MYELLKATLISFLAEEPFEVLDVPAFPAVVLCPPPPHPVANNAVNPTTKHPIHHFLRFTHTNPQFTRLYGCRLTTSHTTARRAPNAITVHGPLSTP